VYVVVVVGAAAAAVFLDVTRKADVVDMQLFCH